MEVYQNVSSGSDPIFSNPTTPPDLREDFRAAVNLFDKSLKDPEISSVIEEEVQTRDQHTLQMHHGGNILSFLEHIVATLPNQAQTKNLHKIKEFARTRALKAFNLNEKVWGVNILPEIRNIAKFNVFTSVADNSDKILNIAHSHQKTMPSYINEYFMVMQYVFDEPIDYGAISRISKCNPKLITCNPLLHQSHLYDFNSIREVCNECGAIMHVDVSDIVSSLLTCKYASNNPFLMADLVTMSVEMCGSLIFFRKAMRHLNEIIPQEDETPFKTFGAIALFFNQVTSFWYLTLQEQALKNSEEFFVCLKDATNFKARKTPHSPTIWLEFVDEGAKAIHKILKDVNFECALEDSSTIAIGFLQATRKGLHNKADVRQIADIINSVVDLYLKTKLDAGVVGVNAEVVEAIGILKESVIEFVKSSMKS